MMSPSIETGLVRFGAVMGPVVLALALLGCGKGAGESCSYNTDCKDIGDAAAVCFAAEPGAGKCMTFVQGNAGCPKKLACPKGEFSMLTSGEKLTSCACFPDPSVAASGAPAAVTPGAK